MQQSDFGPDRIFPPATGLISARRNLLSHLLRLADVRLASGPTSGGAEDPFGQGDAYLDALQHIAELLDPSFRPSVLTTADSMRAALKRLDALWTEIVIAEADPLSAQKACDYAHKLLSRFPMATACYVNECANSFAEPQIALDLLAHASRFIGTMEDGVRIGRAQSHVVRVILQRRNTGASMAPEPQAEVCAPEPVKSVVAAASATPPALVLANGHRAALNRLMEMAEIFYNRSSLDMPVALRLFPLVVAPTGAGKSFLIKKAAEILKADYLKVTRGDWCPRGAKSGRPTTFLILDRLLASDRVCFHLDEGDKFILDVAKEWSAGIGSDLWNILDGHFPIRDYLHETKFGDKPAPTVQEMEGKIRTKLWIVGSGTWQDVFARARKSASLGFTTAPVATQVTADTIRLAGAISPELLLRFNSDLIFLNYPTPEETPGLLRSTGITAIADELGITLTADDVDWQRGGMRVLETLATRLTIEKHRRGKSARDKTSI